MAGYHYKSTGKVEYDEYYIQQSELIIDDIDLVLVEYYGFTDEEVDSLINYEMKHRMGRER